MSSPIWTPAALRSESRSSHGACWRLVEAQHRVSTMKLVDTLDEQALLEDELEATKPPLPASCVHLDYLLATPFRYGRYPGNSRFRREGYSPGVFYASEQVETAVAETAFYRLLFFVESPGNAVAAQCPRIHRLRSALRHDQCHRSHQRVFPQPGEAMDAPDRLFRLPRPCRRRA